MDCPTSLKSVKPYLDRASEVQAKDPIVAYHCRLFALQEAMKLRASVPKADMGFVLSLMDQCEKEKGALGEMDEPAITVENFAQDLFQRADDADRAGRSDLRTGKAFLAASHIFDVCKQFEELPADISEKAKYAKWRFVEIAKATKEGRPPAPPGRPARRGGSSAAGGGRPAAADAGRRRAAGRARVRGAAAGGRRARRPRMGRRRRRRWGTRRRPAYGAAAGAAGDAGGARDAGGAGAGGRVRADAGLQADAGGDPGGAARRAAGVVGARLPGLGHGDAEAAPRPQPPHLRRRRRRPSERGPRGACSWALITTTPPMALRRQYSMP